MSAGSSESGNQLVRGLITTPASLWLCSLVFRSFIDDSRFDLRGSPRAGIAWPRQFTWPAVRHQEFDE